MSTSIFALVHLLMFVVQRRPQKELLLNLSMFAPGNLNDNMEGGVRGSVWDVVEWRDWPRGVFEENLWEDWTYFFVCYF